MYPAPRQNFDPVGLDKAAFGDAIDLPKSGLKLNAKSRKSQNFESKDVKYLRNDPGSLFSTKYAVKNYRDVRSIASRQTNVPTLLWSTSLRGDDFDITSFHLRASKTCKAG